MKVISVYEASDGTRFDNEARCVDREEYLKFRDVLAGDDIIYCEINWRDTSACEVAEWLWKNFDIKRKENK